MSFWGISEMNLSRRQAIFSGIIGCLWPWTEKAAERPEPGIWYRMGLEKSPPRAGYLIVDKSRCMGISRSVHLYPKGTA